jgi:hypothetical protein
MFEDETGCYEDHDDNIIPLGGEREDESERIVF